MLFADYQPFRPNIAQAVPTQSNATSAGGAAFQNNSFSFIILSLRADAITATLCRADVVFDTQSFFMGGPDVLLCQSARVPECQAHQHDCQAYQE